MPLGLASQHAVFAENDAACSRRTLRTTNPGAWQAFEASERGRARSLRYAMNQMPGASDTGRDEPDTERFQQLMQRISQLASRAIRRSAADLAGLACRNRAHGDAEGHRIAHPVDNTAAARRARRNCHRIRRGPR